MSLAIDTRKTALILIDLQNGIMAMPMQPHAKEGVLSKANELVNAFRKVDSPVVFVRVDLASMNRLTTDVSHGDPSAPPPPPEASKLVPDSGFREGDLMITKRHWGAFGRTGLETELRSRGITTIVLGGVMTGIGVESTAREAASLGFDVVLAEDASSSIDAEGHTYTVTRVVPLLGRVRSTAEIVAAIA